MSSNACCGLFTVEAICHGFLKKLMPLAGDRTGDPLILRRTLYHGLYHKTIQVYDIPNLYPVTSICAFLYLFSAEVYYKHIRL